MAVDQKKVSDLTERYLDTLKECETHGCLHEGLAAIAHALQAKLTYAGTDKIVPHAGSFEMLMRAIAHGIEGKPEMEAYVLQKATIGYNSLSASLT